MERRIANMARQRKSAAERAQLVEAYGRSGLSREEFSRRAGISAGMLDYYRRRHEANTTSGLVRVEVRPAELDGGVGKSTFCLVLGNGRRIESDWRFSESDLARLIRLAEAV